MAGRLTACGSPAAAAAGRGGRGGAGVNEYGLVNNNPNPQKETHRALFLALIDWVTKGTEPPPSQYPRLDRGELVPPEAAAMGCSRVHWLTHETNTNAMQLYDRIADRSGFVQYRKLFG